MTTTTQGQAAEAAVADQLKRQGYAILHRNYRTKVCEIDLIAKCGQIVYFIEVKYRVRPEQGSGFEHITPKKLNQMRFASRIWCQNYNWSGDCRLLGVEVSGLDFEAVELVEID